MNYGMIATGNHCNSDSLRGAPLPAGKGSSILGVLAKTYRVPGRHECLPYSNNVKCSKIYKHQFAGMLRQADMHIFLFIPKGFLNCQFAPAMWRMTSPARIRPAAPGTKETLPGIWRLPNRSASSRPPWGVRASSGE